MAPEHSKEQEAFNRAWAADIAWQARRDAETAEWFNFDSSEMHHED